MTRYAVYDVFTGTAFGGNPLAVVFDAETLAEAQLQQIAKEFGFSETTFVFPPTRPDTAARVRIFTPDEEIPFAGHPTIGTALALRDEGGPADMVLDLGVGPIACRVSGARAAFTTTVSLAAWPGPPPEVIAACTGLGPSDIRSDRHPPVIASVGLGFAIAELASPEALAAARCVSDPFRAYQPQWPAGSQFMLLVYIRDGDAIQSRVFAPLVGVPEDPATGSAAAALAAWLARHEGRSLSLDISQGVEMGRPSRILARADADGVTISGEAVRVMEGRLLV